MLKVKSSRGGRADTKQGADSAKARRVTRGYEETVYEAGRTFAATPTLTAARLMLVMARPENVEVPRWRMRAEHS